MIQFKSGSGWDLALEGGAALVTAFLWSIPIFRYKNDAFDTYAYVECENIGKEEDVIKRINSKSGKKGAVFLPGDYSSIHDTQYVIESGDLNIEVKKYNIFKDNCNTFLIDLIKDSGNDEVIDRMGYSIIPDNTYKKLSKHYDIIGSE